MTDDYIAIRMFFIFCIAEARKSYAISEKAFITGV